MGNYLEDLAVILRTLAGGIGMVMVAPITALIAGILYHRFYRLRVRINEGR